MDAHSTLAQQVWHRLKKRFSRKAVVALGIIALLGICDTAVAHTMPPLYQQPIATATPHHLIAHKVTGHVTRQITPVTGQPQPTATVGITPTPTTVAGQVVPVTVAPTATPQTAAEPLAAPPVQAVPTAKPKAHPKRTATPVPTEAQTPLHLSNPMTNDTLATNTPWWQSLLDVTWKLALVVGLIYLAMRALAALKGRGFAPGKGLLPRPGKRTHQFLEQIEEIQLAPNHVLHAVRVGERVMLIARTNGTLRALGEAEVADDGDVGANASGLPALPPGNFTGQLMRAWAGLIPPGAVQEDAASATPTPNAEPPDEIADDEDAEAVIDAKWSTVQPDAVSEDTTLPELPLRRGTARPSDAPEPLTLEQEREILWYAEANGDGAAAKKFGLTRQRVTAMRVRHDRQREERVRDKRPATTRPAVPDATRAPEAPAPAPAAPRPTLPDRPRHNPATEPALPATARGSLARTAYRQNAPSATHKPTPLPIKPDVAAAPKTAADAGNDAQSITVGQILAARFGIKIPTTS